MEAGTISARMVDASVPAARGVRSPSPCRLMGRTAAHAMLASRMTLRTLESILRKLCLFGLEIFEGVLKVFWTMALFLLADSR